MKGLIIITILLTSSLIFAQSNTNSTVIYTVTEEPAEYPGGVTALMRFIHDNLSLPKEDLQLGCTRVVLKFVVYEDGSIHEPSFTIQSQERDTWNKEAQKIVEKMPIWKPAKINRKPVKSYFKLPMYIRFM